MRTLLFTIAVALLVGCKHDHDHEVPAAAPAADAGPPANAVQAEMRLLASAMETAVQGIAADDVREVEHALHRVHAAKDQTESALEHGYKPPKGGDMARFKQLDEAFHGELEKLADASHANDVSRTADALGPVLKACHGCHAEFRR